MLYSITWKETTKNQVHINADSESEALNLFENLKYDQKSVYSDVESVDDVEASSIERG